MSTCPRTPAYVPVPPVMDSRFLAGSSGSLGKSCTPCWPISPPGSVYVTVHWAMWAFSEGSSAGSVVTQNRSKRPILFGEAMLGVLLFTLGTMLFALRGYLEAGDKAVAAALIFIAFVAIGIEAVAYFLGP